MTETFDTRLYLLQTVNQLKTHVPETEIGIRSGFDKISDTIAHSAPEIVEARWKDIFNLCSVYINDDKIDWHEKVFNTYQERYIYFKGKCLDDV
jgi:hypothetical protein